jgi:hypothetical protein
MVLLKPEDDPNFRELCERASKEQDHETLMQLVRQINEMLKQKEKHQPQRPGLEGENQKQSRPANVLARA